MWFVDDSHLMMLICPSSSCILPTAYELLSVACFFMTLSHYEYTFPANSHISYAGTLAGNIVQDPEFMMKGDEKAPHIVICFISWNGLSVLWHTILNSPTKSGTPSMFQDWIDIIMLIKHSGRPIICIYSFLLPKFQYFRSTLSQVQYVHRVREHVVLTGMHFGWHCLSSDSIWVIMFLSNKYVSWIWVIWVIMFLSEKYVSCIWVIIFLSDKHVSCISE